MKGMEMLLGTLLKSVNLNPEEVINNFKAAQKLLVDSVTNFDTRLQNLERQLNELNVNLKQSSKLSETESTGEQNGSNTN